MFALEDLRQRPTHYHRDGTPILDNELMPAWKQWALLFETENRSVGSTKTLYGERLSTVFLGLDHAWGGGPPILFETMLFAPEQPRPSHESMERSIAEMRAYTMGEAEQWERDNPKSEDLKEQEEKREERAAYIKKHFPHDQLQLRYTTENEAKDSHETLKMQCLIPPRWRHFLLWTIGREEAWRYYDDEDDED